MAEALQRRGELAVVAAANHLEELVAGQHQLGHQGHQVFQQLHVDADGLGGDGRFLGLAGGHGGGGLLDHGRRSGGGRRHTGLDLGGGLFRLGFRRRRGLLGGLGGGFLGALLGHLGQDVGLGRGLLAGGIGGFHLGQQIGGHGEGPVLDGGCGGGAGGGLIAALGHGVELVDQIFVAAFRLALVLLQVAQDQLDAVDGLKDQGDGVGGDFQLAVAELAQHILGGVRHVLEARQAEETAGALDGVDQTEDILQNRRFRVLFQLHQLDVENGQTFRSLGQKFAEEIIHGRLQLRTFIALSTPEKPDTPPRVQGQHAE